MAKRPTPETIAANLMSPARAALFAINDKVRPDFPGGGEAVTELTKKRLIRRDGRGHLLLTDRGLAVLDASLPSDIRAVANDPTREVLVEVKSALDASDMGHQGLVSNLPQTNSAQARPPQTAIAEDEKGRLIFHQPPDMAHQSTILGWPQTNSAPYPPWVVSPRAAGGVTESFLTKALNDSIPASPPYVEPSPLRGRIKPRSGCRAGDF